MIFARVFWPGCPAERSGCRASQPRRLAVPGGRPGAGAKCLLTAVRAACPDRGPGVLAGGPGARLALQLDLGDRLRHARLRVPALSDRAATLTAVAACRVVRGWGVDADFGRRGRVHRPLLVAPLQL